MKEVLMTWNEQRACMEAICPICNQINDATGQMRCEHFVSIADGIGHMIFVQREYQEQ